MCSHTPTLPLCKSKSGTRNNLTVLLASFILCVPGACPGTMYPLATALGPQLSLRRPCDQALGQCTKHNAGLPSSAPPCVDGIVAS